MGLRNKVIKNLVEMWTAKKGRIPGLFVLGVTGVIGSGKSTLCRFLWDKYGFYWIEADKIVRELYKIGGAGYKKIVKHFGAEFVNKKEVDRDRLREFVLKNKRKIFELNKLIHPLVFDDVNKKLVQLKRSSNGKKPILVCIEAVYFEKKLLGKFIDHLIIVDALDSVIIKRLIRGKSRRKIAKAELLKLIKFQRKKFLKMVK